MQEERAPNYRRISQKTFPRRLRFNSCRGEAAGEDSSPQNSGVFVDIFIPLVFKSILSRIYKAHI